MEAAETRQATTPVARLPHPQEGPIRTLGVSLVAIAAIAASMTIARQRSEQRQPEPRPGHNDVPASVNLDAIRTAGL